MTNSLRNFSITPGLPHTVFSILRQFTQALPVKSMNNGFPTFLEYASALSKSSKRGSL